MVEWADLQVRRKSQSYMGGGHGTHRDRSVMVWIAHAIGYCALEGRDIPCSGTIRNHKQCGYLADCEWM